MNLIISTQRILKPQQRKAFRRNARKSRRSDRFGERVLGQLQLSNFGKVSYDFSSALCIGSQHRAGNFLANLCCALVLIVLRLWILPALHLEVSLLKVVGGLGALQYCLTPVIILLALILGRAAIRRALHEIVERGGIVLTLLADWLGREVALLELWLPIPWLSAATLSRAPPRALIAALYLRPQLQPCAP